MENIPKILTHEDFLMYPEYFRENIRNQVKQEPIKSRIRHNNIPDRNQNQNEKYRTNSIKFCTPGKIVRNQSHTSIPLEKSSSYFQKQPWEVSQNDRRQTHGSRIVKNRGNKTFYQINNKSNDMYIPANTATNTGTNSRILNINNAFLHDKNKENSSQEKFINELAQHNKMYPSNLSKHQKTGSMITKNVLDKYQKTNGTILDVFHAKKLKIQNDQVRNVFEKPKQDHIQFILDRIRDNVQLKENKIWQNDRYLNVNQSIQEQNKKIMEKIKLMKENEKNKQNKQKSYLQTSLKSVHLSFKQKQNDRCNEESNKWKDQSKLKMQQKEKQNKIQILELQLKKQSKQIIKYKQERDHWQEKYQKLNKEINVLEASEVIKCQQHSNQSFEDNQESFTQSVDILNVEDQSQLNMQFFSSKKGFQLEIGSDDQLETNSMLFPVRKEAQKNKTKKCAQLKQCPMEWDSVSEVQFI